MRRDRLLDSFHKASSVLITHQDGVGGAAASQVAENHAGSTLLKNRFHFGNDLNRKKKNKVLVCRSVDSDSC